MLYQFLLATRPRQWVKNAVVLAALVFSRHLRDAEYLVTALAAAGAFVILSAAVYLFNDVADYHLDRIHPDKSKRPIASGRLPRWLALSASLALTVGSVWAGWLLQHAFGMVLVVYAVLNAAYSLGLKRAVLVDILVIASGFLLRAVGGAVVIDVEISSWFILCTFTLTLLLAAGKRRQELVVLEEGAAKHRPALAAYDVAFLDQVIGLLASATVVCYALYAIGVGDRGLTAKSHMQWTVPFVLYGVLRYLYLVSRGRGEDPTALLWRDRPLQLALALWAGLSLALVYGGGG